MKYYAFDARVAEGRRGSSVFMQLMPKVKVMPEWRKVGVAHLASCS